MKLNLPRRLRPTVLLIASASLIFIGWATPARGAFDHFITRSGDRLMDGETPFRFMGVEAFDIHYRYNNLAARWELPAPWEQEDGFKTIRHMGSSANRIYALAVRKHGEDTAIIRHVEAPDVFNEEAFRALDKAVQLAGQHGIRLVISFLDGRNHWGGPGDYAAFRGKPAAAFWSDPQLKTDFKATLTHLLKRTNHHTGVPYKDDPTIFAWELGNELDCTYAWSSEMAAYLKRLDSNHLVASGHYVREQEIPVAYLSDPNIDLIDAHYYGYHGYASLAAKLREHVTLTTGKRPMLVGEFGMDATAALTDLMDAIIANPNVAGGLLWNLRVHSADGGYFRKDGATVAGVFYRGYRWPGYPASGGAWDEAGSLAAIRTRAFAIRGLPVPPLPVPDAPVLLASSRSGRLVWRGSTSASSYIVERAPGPDGPWTGIAPDVTDDRDTGEPLFIDPEGPGNYYRVKARNDTGTSAQSNVVGPLAPGLSH